MCADEKNISFFNNIKYKESLLNTKAAVVILAKKHVKFRQNNIIIHNNPQLIFVKITEILNKKVISEYIHPSVIIGKGCKIGKNTVIYPNVTIYDNVTIGDNCIIHSGAVIGADGFGVVQAENGVWQKIPQIGGVTIGNNVEIGANTTIDRGALDNTIIEDNVKIDNLVQIAHNVKVGYNTLIAACVVVAGSCVVGKNCMIGGNSSLNGHCYIADNTIIAATTVVASSIKKAGVYSSSLTHKDHKDNLRINAAVKKLLVPKKQTEEVNERE